MIRNRLELALERLQPSDWNRFERLASDFLSNEFASLRTVASPSGDAGRDAELFSPQNEPTVVLQYSITEDWKKKIRETVSRLCSTIPSARVLIYVTNRVVGAEADDLKAQLRKTHGLSLDFRDRNWFLERVLDTTKRQQAAEDLAKVIVDPYLSSVGVGPHVQAELTSNEAIAAVTFLGLQWQDDTRDKGLTKLTFDALLRSALVGTDSNNRIHRSEVHKRIASILPGHNPEQLRRFIESSLHRLAKHVVKHWPKEDEFCLAHDEILRFSQFRVEAALAEHNLIDSIQKIVNVFLTENSIEVSYLDYVTTVVRAATDAVLFERSQAFAMSVQSGTLAGLSDTDFKATIASEISKASLPKLHKVDWMIILRNCVQQILISNDPSILKYLRSLADSYTLLAFLKQTPDVQSAVEKMFSHGMLWLDATIVLPLIADTLTELEGEKGRFTRMIEAANDAGLKLNVTPGVIEEVERHMNRAKTCVRKNFQQWEGSIPYLLERYLESGLPSSSFPNWLENFLGNTRPLQDLSDYLREEFSIETRSLQSECDAAEPELRHALQSIWYGRYERRREKYGTQLDQLAVDRLVSHDVECYAGVAQLRTKEKPSPFGYSAWWLTVDQHTFDLKPILQRYMTTTAPDSPVMSADFLVNYLAFGPVRKRVTKDQESHLPLFMVLRSAARLTPELIIEAERIRSQFKDRGERVLRRQVRDQLDRARAHIGPIATLGMDLDDEDDNLQ